MTANDVKASEIEEVGPSDMDLIEFLGGWETEEGQWVDPALFDAVFSEDVPEREEAHDSENMDSILLGSQQQDLSSSKANQDLKDERK